MPTNTTPVTITGNIFKVPVKPGQAVKSGDILIILEAMKMETEVRSPFDGTIVSVAVKEGDTVEHGQTLVEIA